ncbi:methyltransferase domain-containing protein [Streptomyces hoynatensis]|uniref:Methyltransferase domain-containing protein n=1 Tax=Streptomyces hoynatensis TaxID=1141874 RepID=A0A3A9ZC29_9ACTN|nr:methyltransferase domain-containing protein [Streptomyces hoynatensis]RKN45828.1 methyltransferase domain-containing protein [Streptomyces hoynatensis]
MNEVLGTRRPDQVAPMGEVAEAGRAYKSELLAGLELAPGQTALDVGCGPGTDLPALLAGVGADGRVIGVDREPGMLEAARRLTAGDPRVTLREGDAHALPVADGEVDRARVDRVLMHVADPPRVLAELRRVGRPGAVIGLAEPDWDTLVVDSDDLDTARAFTRFTATVAVRNATIGRRLPRLAEEAGFRVESVTTTTPVLREVTAADRLLGLGRNTLRAIEQGLLDERRGRDWFASLSERPFLAAVTIFTVVAHLPA